MVMLFQNNQQDNNKVGFISTVATTMIVMYLAVYVFAYLYKGMVMFLDWLDGKPKEQEQKEEVK
jgi:hypothetical protein